MSTKTTRELVNETGVVVGHESQQGQEASTIDIAPGSSVIFGEGGSDNKTEVYDPASGQSMVELVKGQRDVSGSINMYHTDFRWLYWASGSDTVDEFVADIDSGTPVDTDTVGNGTWSADVDSVSNISGSLYLITFSNLTSGPPSHSDSLTFTGSGATGTLSAFVHDLAWADIIPSLTVCQIYETVGYNQKYTGMTVNEATLTSSRGEIVVVDLDLVGISELVPDTPAETRVATSKTPWIWSTGDVVIDGDTYTNVCDNIQMSIIRGAVARGGHDDEEANAVILGNRKIEISLDMAFSDFDLRTIRRNNTKFTITLTFTNTENDDEATITLTNCQLDSDPIEIARDGEDVTYSTLSKTGEFSGRVFDDIYDYTTA